MLAIVKAGKKTSIHVWIQWTPYADSRQEAFMEDPLKRFTEEQKQVVISWLNEKGAIPGGCPSCKHPQMSLIDHFGVMASRGTDGTMFFDRVFPLVALQCGKCANMLFYNAIPIGLVAPSKAASEE